MLCLFTRHRPSAETHSLGQRLGAEAPALGPCQIRGHNLQPAPESGPSRRHGNAEGVRNSAAADGSTAGQSFADETRGSPGLSRHRRCTERCLQEGVLPSREKSDPAETDSKGVLTWATVPQVCHVIADVQNCIHKRVGYPLGENSYHCWNGFKGVKTWGRVVQTWLETNVATVIVIKPTCFAGSLKFCSPHLHHHSLTCRTISLRGTVSNRSESNFVNTSPTGWLENGQFLFFSIPGPLHPPPTPSSNI